MNAAEAILDSKVRVAGLPALVGFTVVLMSLLALVFPTGREYAELTAVTNPDAYSVAYLEVLTRANPRETELRFVYGRQLSALGRYEEAIATVTPTLEQPAAAITARNLLLDIHLARARTIPEGDPRRSAAMADVLRLLHEVATAPQTPERNEALAGLALELGDPKLAAQLYVAVAAQRPAEAPRMFALAAKWFRAAGENTKASSYAQVAASIAKVPSEAADHAAFAVESLEADDKPVPAADLAVKYAVAFPTNTRILALATRLSTATGRLADARSHGRRLLALTPDDEQVIRAQAMRELAAADPKAALPLLSKLVARHPDDYDLRVLRVRTAEWAGDLDLAERDLLWLVAHPKKRG